MNAKQPLAVLYARVPAGVKEQLQLSAKLRNHSLGDEVNRLVQSQSRNSFSSDSLLRLRTHELAVQRRLLAFLYGLIDTASKQQTHAARAQMFERIGATYCAKRLEEEARLAQKIEEAKMAHAMAEEGPALSPFALGLGGQRDLGRASQQPALSDRRRQALQLALEASPRGTKAKLAHSLRLSRSQFSQLLSGFRSISEQVARALEVELKLAPGFLDKIEPDSAKAAQQVAVADISKLAKRTQNKLKT
jgi:transcriptional regulator with XRE-family HTH domain